MTEINNEFWQRHLLFRNYLKENPNVIYKYALLKKELAKKDWKESNDFAKAKTEFIKKIEIKASMFMYYNERAEEYEDIYIQGAGPASIADPQAYKTEVSILENIVKKFCHGKIIDIACGTGFWLPNYAFQCSHITLIDQSSKMISECESKINSLGINDKCTLLKDDFLEYQFGTSKFDFALIGFFLSHLNKEQERAFFEKLRTILKPSGNFLIFDSTWNTERAKTRAKQGKHQRKLNDGRTYDIYKRYFDESDIKIMAKEHQLSLTIEHLGKVFVAVLGKFNN
jgi:demethylmenaquinone methyltransferase/2-methoxy-6-polyprenyl-1,4-benzoquinol methylase